MKPLTITILTSLAVSLFLLPTTGRGDQAVFADGLDGPVKLDVTRRGNLLVTERGTGQNDGRLSLVDQHGYVMRLLSGLPSGIEGTGAPSGPTAVLVQNCCTVELLIGEGDGLRFEMPGASPRMMPNPVGPVSPIFSSMLRVRFDRAPEELTAGFDLAAADHERLADGGRVNLVNDSGEKVSIWMVADLKDFRPDPVTNVRNSNPFAMAHPGNGAPLIVDAGANSVVRIRSSGPPRTLLRFAPVPNPTGMGPPVSDAVPTSIRHLAEDRYLVALFVGVPFVPGTASIRLLDTSTGTESELLSGLTSVSDVLRIGSTLYVLELSTNLGQGAPGRLLRFAKDSDTPEEIASGLIGASGMTYSRRDRAIYIAEVFIGQITRVGL